MPVAHVFWLPVAIAGHPQPQLQARMLQRAGTNRRAGASRGECAGKKLATSRCASIQGLEGQKQGRTRAQGRQKSFLSRLQLQTGRQSKGPTGASQHKDLALCSDPSSPLKVAGQTIGRGLAFLHRWFNGLGGDAGVPSMVWIDLSAALSRAHARSTTPSVFESVPEISGSAGRCCTCLLASPIDAPALPLRLCQSSACVVGSKSGGGGGTSMLSRQQGLAQQ